MQFFSLNLISNLKKVGNRFYDDSTSDLQWLSYKVDY